MTTLYVSSVSGDNTDGSTWAKAYTNITNALAALTGTGPHIIYVDSAHSYTAGTTITYNLSASGQQLAMISVNRGGSTTTGHSGHQSGAAEYVGAAAANLYFLGNSNNGSVFVKGILWRCGASSVGGLLAMGALNSTSARYRAVFEDCTFENASTQAATAIFIGSYERQCHQDFRFNNCTFKLPSLTANTACIRPAGITAVFSKCTFGYYGASKPTALFNFLGYSSNTATTPRVDLIDCDLSGYNTSGGSYFLLTNHIGGAVNVVNCKLSSTPALTSHATAVAVAFRLNVVNSDGSDTNNFFRCEDRYGTLTQDTAIYRNSGALFSGSNVGWKIVTTSACSENDPFISPWIHRWVNATGSTTFSLEILRDSATDYTDRQVWMEVEVLEDASFPVGTLTSTRNAEPYDGTAVDLTNSTDGAWTESLTNDNEMIISATRTVAEKSLVRARLHVAVASTTLYLDPMLYISGQPNNCPTRWTVEGAVNAEPVVPKANYIAGL